MSAAGDAVAAGARRARSGEIDTLAGVLARAFFDDPVYEWMFPRERSRPAHTRRFFGLRLRQLHAQDEIYTDGGLAGAACWAQPDRWRAGTVETLTTFAALLPGFGLRTPRMLRGLHAIESVHPGEPHWFLAALGVDPARQGAGIGSRVLAPVLERCDADGVAAYLESSKERNIAFYARHGFRVSGEIDLPRGPRMWSMWRDPR